MLLAYFLYLGGAIAQETSDLKLWYTQPAQRWVEALPVGNGRLGAMIYGNPDQETIQLNENTVWSGQPNRNDNPAAKAALPEVRKLIFEGKYKEAQDLANQNFFGGGANGMSYQVVGNLKLQFPEGEYSDYYRELDLENAVATTKYRKNGISYQLKTFSSFPDQVIVVQITVDKPGALSFSATMDRPSGGNMSVSANTDKQLIMSGTTSDLEGVKGAVLFGAQIAIKTDGTISANTDTLSVTGAATATLYISMASSFKNYKDISGNPGEKAGAFLRKAMSRKYDKIYEDHIKDFQQYFNRVQLNLGSTDAVKKPTNIRLDEFASGNDPQLVSLYFQFGRYLLISSSRPGGQPANLQGLWADQLFPAWDSKYTVNINTEMNYWPSELTNLTEMNEPLVQMIHELSQTGRQTAKDMYGVSGWVTHHNTDIWRITGPVDGSFWGMWPMGEAWLSQHLFDKYDYSGDTDFLKLAYPVVKEASRFLLEFLVAEPEHGWLVVAPSISPENAPSAHPDASISAGTTMDNQLVFDLFTKTIRTAEILHTDEEFVAELKKSLKKLPPMQIGKWGQLQEWMYDWDNPKDNHRHVSHLYGLYPSNQISPYTTPLLFEAAKTSLEARGDESTGWSMGWKVNLWARLLDGNHAYKLIQDQLTPALQSTGRPRGGTYPNLFDSHPPFQIDGNFGCTAGIAEMLMQSHDGAIHILPSLPDRWEQGSVSGLKARGGFELGVQWKDNKPYEVTIESFLGGNCRIRSYYPLEGKGLKEAKGKNSNPFYTKSKIPEPIISPEASMNGGSLKQVYEYDLQTSSGKTYTLKALQ